MITTRAVRRVGRSLPWQLADFGLCCVVALAPVVAQTGRHLGPQGICDLAISKRMLPDFAVDSERVTLTLTVQNRGTAPCGTGSDTVLVQDPTAPGLKFPPQQVSVSHRGWKCSITPGGLTCRTSATLASRYTVSFVLAGQVTGAPGSSFRNCATVGASDDGDLANNTACATIRVIPGKGGGIR